MNKEASMDGTMRTRNRSSSCLPVYKVSVNGGGREMRIMNNRRIIACGDVVWEVRYSPEVHNAVHAPRQEVPARGMKSLASLVWMRGPQGLVFCALTRVSKPSLWPSPPHINMQGWSACFGSRLQNRTV